MSGKLLTSARLRAGGYRCSVGSKRGFTLVELLVVMAIIAILIGSLVPALRRSIRQTYSTVCKTNLHDLHEAITIYRLDNSDWLPVRGADERLDNAGSSWISKLFEDNPAGRGSLICPADPWASHMREMLSVAALNLWDNSSYGMNDFIASSPDGFLGNLGRYNPTRPGDTLLLADLGPDTLSAIDGGEYVGAGSTRSLGRLQIDDGFVPGSQWYCHNATWLTSRHLGKINALTIAGNIKELSVGPVLGRVVSEYYSDCAAQECTLCLEVGVAHYSFAESKAFWWTGPLPQH